MRKLMWFIDEQVCALVKMTPGWNAPQGVENLHTLCAGKPGSGDRGNNIQSNLSLETAQGKHKKWSL